MQPTLTCFALILEFLSVQKHIWELFSWRVNRPDSFLSGSSHKDVGGFFNSPIRARSPPRDRGEIKRPIWSTVQPPQNAREASCGTRGFWINIEWKERQRAPQLLIVARLKQVCAPLYMMHRSFSVLVSLSWSPDRYYAELGLCMVWSECLWCFWREKKNTFCLWLFKAGIPSSPFALWVSLAAINTASPNTAISNHTWEDCQCRPSGAIVMPAGLIMPPVLLEPSWGSDRGSPLSVLFVAPLPPKLPLIGWINLEGNLRRSRIPPKLTIGIVFYICP